jgi:putative hydrolase of the HAD superfamily
MQKVEALLFDLGGVVVGVDFERAFRAWEDQSALSIEEIRRRFKMDEAYEKHERGEIGASEYFSHLRLVLALEGTDASIALGWNAIFVEEMTESMSYIRAAAERIPCFAFSNSNPTHQAWWSSSYPSVVALFRRVFVSSELGMRKPERAAFEAISAATNIVPGSILFFDDSIENVRGAREAGLRAIHVQGPADVKSALLEIGAL